MRARYIVPLSFTLLLTFGAWRQLAAGPVDASYAAAISAIRTANPPQDPGVFPDEWIHGADCENDRAFQVHAYNQDTFIIRQSKCETYEAPFLYLLFGEDEALLLDTGANPSSPVADTVMRTIDKWLEAKGRESIPLTVAHTHEHGDHVQGDSQFQGLDGVTQVVGAGKTPATAFWGFQDYPEDKVTYDLGGRVLDILGTPGHSAASISVYDRNTHLLLSGDIVYPGHLFVFSPSAWPMFVKSIRRLGNWARTHPVEWVVGCHVEMTTTPGLPYKYTTAIQPDEHPLQLHPKILGTLLEASQAQGADPECTILDEVVIHIVYKCGILWNGES